MNERGLIRIKNARVFKRRGHLKERSGENSPHHFHRYCRLRSALLGRSGPCPGTACTNAGVNCGANGAMSTPGFESPKGVQHRRRGLPSLRGEQRVQFTLTRLTIARPQQMPRLPRPLGMTSLQEREPDTLIDPLRCREHATQGRLRGAGGPAIG